MTRVRRLASLLTVSLVALVAAPGLAPIAHAGPAATPGFEVDPNSLGALTLFDGSGNVITQGSTLAATPFAPFVQAAVARSSSGDTKATLELASPMMSADPSTWPTSIFGGAEIYPNASAPASLGTSALPLYTGAAADETLGAAVSSLPATQYPGIYQLRIYTSGKGHPIGSTYDSLDLQIDTSGNTWQVIYPVTATATSAASVSPTSPAASGTSETLSATVTPIGLAGTVSFSDGSTALTGTSAYTQSTGSGTLTTTLPSGSHSITATFTPTDTTAITGSSSATPTSYTVNAVPTPTSTTTSTVAVSPSSPAAAGSTETLTATVTPANAAGTVAFTDSGVAVPGTVSFTGGTATLMTTLASGSHSLSAAFTPTDSTAYTTSSSSTATSYTVSATPSSTPFEPDPNSLGSVSLFDGTGNAVTSGASLTVAPFAAYAQGAFARSGTGDTKATLELASPVMSADPSTWPTSIFGASQTYPNAAAPGSLGTSTLPLYTGSPQDETLAAAVAALPATAYPQIYQLRIYTSGKGRPIGSTYDSLDLKIDTTAGTFAVVYPAPSPTSTTTSTVAVSPVSPAAAGTQETLTASVTPSGAAGSVSFTDGGAALTGTVTFTGGTATLMTTLPSGSHTLSASFTPTDATAFGPSSSATGTAYTVNAAASSPTSTTTSTVAVSPMSPAAAGTQETLTASVTPSGAAGSVSFTDGGAALTGTVTFTGGTATLMTTLPSGSHTLSASFTPTDATAFGPSSSATGTAYTVNAAAPSPTSTTTSTVAVSPMSPAAAGTQETLTASVTPSGAAGSVSFTDGGAALTGTVTFTGGTATLMTTLPSGSHTLSASFTPTDATAFGPSSSATGTAYTVNAASTAPPFEPDPNSLGAISLFDGSGNPVTAGNSLTSAPFAAFAQGAVARSGTGDTKATLELASPVQGQDPSTWPTSIFGAAATYPNAAAPGSLGTSSLPLYTGSSADETLSAAVAAIPASAYPQIYQLRIYTSGKGRPVGSAYDSLDLKIDTTAGTFTVVYPAPTMTTTGTSVTGVGVTPTSPAAPGTTETLTASVTPMGVAGTVTFKDNGTTLTGTNGSYSATTGAATLQVVLSIGSHSLFAVFAPSATGYSGSSSMTPTSYTVSAAATTSVALSASPSGSQVTGMPTTLTATVTPAAAGGSVMFFDGSNNIGDLGGDRGRCHLHHHAGGRR